VKDVNSPDSPQNTDEGSGGDAEGGDGDSGANQKRPSFTYVAGRIYFDYRGNGRWVYERFNHCFNADKFEGGDLPQALCNLYNRAENELDEQASLVNEARQKVIQNEEERRQAALAAAAKKKPGKGGKKEAVEEEKKDDDKPKGPPPKAELDLLKPADFQ